MTGAILPSQTVKAEPDEPGEATQALTLYAEENFQYLVGRDEVIIAHRFDDDDPYEYTLSFSNFFDVLSSIELENVKRIEALE